MAKTLDAALRDIGKAAKALVKARQKLKGAVQEWEAIWEVLKRLKRKLKAKGSELSEDDLAQLNEEISDLERSAADALKDYNDAAADEKKAKKAYDDAWNEFHKLLRQLMG